MALPRKYELVGSSAEWHAQRLCVSGNWIELRADLRRELNMSKWANVWIADLETGRRYGLGGVYRSKD